MATVSAFSLQSVTIWFYSNDHEPPHFHANRRGEWEVKVHFLRQPSEMIEIVRADKKLPARTLKELSELAEVHRVELLAQWEEVHDQ